MLAVKQTTLFVALFFILAQAILLTILASNPYGFSPRTATMGVISFNIMIAPIFYWAMFTSREQIPYLGLHGFFMAATFGIGGLVYPVGYRGSFESRLSTADFFEPLVYATLSFLIFSISYFLTRKRAVFPVPAAIQNLEKRIDQNTFVIVLFPILLILYYLTVKQGLITSIVQPVIALRVFGIIWGATLLFSGKLNIKQSVIFWTLIVGDIIFNSRIFSGFLAEMIWYTFYFLIPYMVFRRKVPFLLIFAAAFAIFVLNPIKKEFRKEFSDFRVERNVSLDRIETAANLASARIQDLGLASIKDDFDEFYYRVLLITTYAIVVIDVPDDNDYLLGETYLPFFSKIIPRFLWQGKPTTDTSAWAKDNGYLNPNADSAYRLPLHVEMYLNFGIYGVVCISVILGAVLGSIKATFGRYRNNATVFALSLMMVAPFFWPGARFEKLFGGILIQFVSVYIFAFLVAALLPKIRKGAVNRYDKL